MRLSVLNENISRSEFFDLYTLLTASQLHLIPPENIQSANDQLYWLAQTIIRDHADQIAKIVMERISDPEQEIVQNAMRLYGLYDDDSYRIHGIDKLSLEDKIDYINLIKDYQPFGFTGDTWRHLAYFIANFRMPTGITDTVLAIDKIYNLLHHGGQIIDYMDESNWLEDALNYRDNSTLQQLARYASSNTRNIVGRGNLTGDNKTVTENQKLWTSFRRRIGPDDKTTKVDYDKATDTITVSGMGYSIVDLKDGKRFPMTWAVKNRVIEKFEQSEEFQVDRFPWSATVVPIPSGLQVNYQNGTSSTVPLPITRQIRLATDIIHSAANSAARDNVDVGTGFGGLKPDYNYKDNLPEYIRKARAERQAQQAQADTVTA